MIPIFVSFKDTLLRGQCWDSIPRRTPQLLLRQFSKVYRTPVGGSFKLPDVGV